MKEINVFDQNIYEMNKIREKLLSKQIKLEPGGVSLTKKNQNCTSKTSLAIIVPYRNREKHLKLFISNMHPFLTRQKINYGIYLVEPIGNLKFNRGILKNIGYVESLKDRSDWNCFMFHDVDFYPENFRNLYKCDDFFPKHFAVSVQQFGYNKFKM